MQLCSMKGETVSTPLDKDGILTNMVKALLTTIFFPVLDPDECNNLPPKGVTSPRSSNFERSRMGSVLQQGPIPVTVQITRTAKSERPVRCRGNSDASGDGSIKGNFEECVRCVQSNELCFSGVFTSFDPAVVASDIYGVVVDDTGFHGQVHACG